MAIRTVVTRGFGNGTFNGTIPLVVTRGYGIGEEIVQTLSQWHDTGMHSWDQGDGTGDIAPQVRRNTDIGQVIQASGEQT